MVQLTRSLTDNAFRRRSWASVRLSPLRSCGGPCGGFRLATGAVEDGPRSAEVFGVVVAVDAGERLERHAEITGGRPRIGCALHHPRRRGVAQGMRRDAG